MTSKNFNDKQDKKIKIERLILKSREALTRLVEKNEEFFGREHKTDDSDTTSKHVKQWLDIFVKKYDKIFAADRGYIDSVHDKETAEQYDFLKISSHRQRELETSLFKRGGFDKEQE